MTTPTRPRPAGAQTRYLEHARECPTNGNPQRCRECRDLDADASAESWQRANGWIRVTTITPHSRPGAESGAQHEKKGA